MSDCVIPLIACSAAVTRSPHELHVIATANSTVIGVSVAIDHLCKLRELLLVVARDDGVLMHARARKSANE